MSESMHEEEHTGLMKTPSQVFWVSAAAFVIPIFTIIGLVTYFSSGKDQSPGETDAAQKIAARIQKVGTVEIRDANRPLASGEDVYKAQCIACHGTGVSGAPKFGNAADWAPRIKQGYDTLLHSALAGKGAMAPQGGGNYSDVEIGRAVVYMANQGGAKFDEPAAPAAAATETAAAAPAPAAAAAPAATAPAPAAAAAAVPAATAAAAPAGGGVDLAAGKKMGRPRPRPRPRPPHPRAAASTWPPARRSTTPPASPAMAAVWPVRPSSATRRPGRRAWRPASTRC